MRRPQAPSQITLPGRLFNKMRLVGLVWNQAHSVFGKKKTSRSHLKYPDCGWWILGKVSLIASSLQLKSLGVMASLSWKQVIQHPTCQSDWAPYPKQNLFRWIHKFEEFDTNKKVLGKKLSPPQIWFYFGLTIFSLNLQLIQQESFTRPHATLHK